MVKENAVRKRKPYIFAMKAIRDANPTISVPDAANLVAEEAVQLRHFKPAELPQQARRFSKGFSELKMNKYKKKNHKNAKLTIEDESFLVGIFEGFAMNGIQVDKAFILSFVAETFDITVKDSWYFIEF